MAAESSNFHPKNKSKKTKTYPQGNAPINENQTENKHFTIDTQKFVLFWLGSVKVKDLRSVVMPSTPDPSTILYHNGLVHVEVGIGNTCRSGSGHW